MLSERDIFIEALQKADANEREAYLRVACEGQPALFARVGELLRIHEQATSFLESPVVSLPVSMTATGDTHPPESPGAVIGPYTLLEVIGEGGMGVVYLAEQHVPVRRKVALKVIKPGMDTRQVVARFEAERQALAMMDHPNIARVLDAGTTPNGRPYFVMELVHGVPITRYCDDARLTPRQRLELFIPVCQAVQHAHQKGIIHRDIKPSNVLIAQVDGKPVPKVIDFGVAKAIDPRPADRSAVTHHGAIVGTPEYMSPEQAGAVPDVDTRTDVYGLGVLLYELLTGTTPLDRASLQEAALDKILERVREEEPPKPSTRLNGTDERLPSVAAVRGMEPARLSRLVRGDLDWVVMKALEKDRARRYETAAAFANDIQRHLDNDPVEAGPPSRIYRLKKFARKHRTGLVAITAVVVGLVVAVSALAVSTVVVSRGRAEALRELAKVRAERLELAHVYFQENTLVGEALGDIKNKSFEMESWKKREFELVDRAVQFQELFARQLLSDPEARFEAAFCYYKSGDNEVGLAAEDQSEVERRRRIKHAIQSHRRASDLLSQLHAESPRRRDYREALQSTLSHLGIILLVEKSSTEAEQILRRALALDDPLTGEYTPGPWREWPAGRIYTGRGFVFLARLVMERNPREAEAILRRGLAHMEEWCREAPGNKGLLRALELGQFQQILTLRVLGEHDQITARLRELARREINDPGVCNEVAWWLATNPDPRHREPGQAVALARKATDLAPKVAAGWNTLGVALYRAGIWDEAIKALSRSVELTSGGEPADWFFLAMAHWQKGDRKEARSWYDKAVTEMERNQSKDEELIRFRAEAKVLLQTENPTTTMPYGTDAFAR